MCGRTTSAASPLLQLHFVSFSIFIEFRMGQLLLRRLLVLLSLHLFTYCFVFRSLSIVTFNARGLKNNTKCKLIFVFAKKHKVDFCFIQESHSVPDDKQFWRSQ